MTPEIQIIYGIESKVGPHHKLLLNRKVQQYRDRLNEDVGSRSFVSPEEIISYMARGQTYYSLAVLEEVLKRKHKNISTIRNTIASELGTKFDHVLFDNACGIVDGYTKDKSKLAESLQK